MKYLRLFKIINEYEEEKDNLILPNVNYCKEDGLVRFAPKANQLIATYNVTSTSSATSLLGLRFGISRVSEMYVDDVQVTPSSAYTFTTAGNHKVKIVFNDNFNNCANMFYSCSSLTSLDLSNFDTSNVTSMSNMFYSCSGLTSLDLSNFDTSNVKSMTTMFYGCSGLTSLDLSNFGTSNLTNMSNMFYGCAALKSLDLSNFDTSNVTSMSSMFYQCTSLTSIDLSNFDTSSVISMDNMFSACSSLTSVKMLGSTNASATVTDMFSAISTTGTFYYNDEYDYSHITAALPSTWTAVAV